MADPRRFSPMSDDPMDQDRIDFDPFIDDEMAEGTEQSEAQQLAQPLKTTFTPVNAPVAQENSSVVTEPQQGDNTAVVMVVDDLDENDEEIDGLSEVSSVDSVLFDMPTDMESDSEEGIQYKKDRKAEMKNAKRKRHAARLRKYIEVADNLRKETGLEPVSEDVWNVVNQAEEDANKAASSSKNPVTPKKKGKATQKESGIPSRADAIKRFKKAAKDCPDNILIREIRIWLDEFYDHRENLPANQRTSLSSDAYFRRTVSTPMENVLSKYKKDELWTGDLPSRAVLIGSTFVHQVGQSNAKVMGTLLLIQRLDLISIPEIVYTNNTRSQTVLLNAIQDRITDLDAKLDGHAAEANVTREIADMAAATAKSIEPVIEEHSDDILQITGNLRKKAEKAKNLETLINGLDHRLQKLTQKVNLLDKKADNLNALDKFKSKDFKALVDKVTSMEEKLRDSVGDARAPTPASRSTRTQSVAIPQRAAKHTRQPDSPATSAQGGGKKRRTTGLNFGDNDE